jgi:predicted kinase
MILDKLRKKGFDFQARMPEDLLHIYNFLLEITNDTLESENEKLNLLDYNVWLAIKELQKSNPLVIEVDTEVIEQDSLINNEGFETIIPENIEPELKETQMIETEVKTNLWTKGDFFKANPDKVLGEAYEASGAYGKVTKYKGTLEDLNKIDVSFDFISEDQGQMVTVSEIKEKNPEDDSTNIKAVKNIENAITKGKDEAIDKTSRKISRKEDYDDIDADLDLYEFEEIVKEYNPEISEEEMQAYLWYKNSIGQALGGSWNTIFDPLTIDADEEEKLINSWVKNGVLCYFRSNLIPAFLYYSEDITEKKTALHEEKEDLIEIYGQAVYDNQFNKLEEIVKNVRKKWLILDPPETDEKENVDRRLRIIPKSRFAKKYKIATLYDEKPFTTRASGREADYGKPDWKHTGAIRGNDKKVFTELSLQEAFIFWLKYNKHEYQIKKGLVNWRTILDYFNDKPRPKEADAADFKKLMANSREEAERLFELFLAKFILKEDQKKIEILWNDQFNSYVPINYNKVPIGMRFSRTFYNETMDIRPEKREAVAMLTTQGAGCLAYEVGVGKANLLTSNILTPNGWVKMGDIKVGDYVIGKNGKPTKVLGVFPQGKVQSSKVIFSDGSSTEVSNDHLWNVQTPNHRSKYKDSWYTLETKELIGKLRRPDTDSYWYSIPMVDPVEFNEQELPIDPYLLGVLLGDGCMTGDTHLLLSNSNIELQNKVKPLIESFGISMKSKNNDGKDFRLSGDNNGFPNNKLIKALRELDLMGCGSSMKFVPQSYLYNSIENRIKLLQGLMDTDGTVQKNGTIIFTTTSSQLAGAIKFLVNSFGGTVGISRKEAFYTYKKEKKQGKLAYNISIKLPNNIIPFSIKYHIDKLKLKSKYLPVRFIDKIEDIGYHEAQCIKVEAEDHLYVCDDFIVTHNTPAAIFTIEQFLENGYSKRPFIVVPNQVYKQFMAEVKLLLPHRKVIGLYNMSEDYLYELKGKNGVIEPVEEKSITIMTYEGFQSIGFNEETANLLLSKLYDVLNQSDEEGAKKSSAKKEESFMEKLQNLIGRGMKGGKINIEDIGLDFMIFDEAHAMKKVFTRVKSKTTEGDNDSLGSKRGRVDYEISSGSPSDIALKGFMVSQYIYHNNNDRNVLLLTATPFTNSPLEVFSMLSLIAYKDLQKTNLNNINNFFDNYVSVSTDLVINHKLRPQRKQVFLGFKNLISLQKIIFRYINFKHPDIADINGFRVKVERPNKYVLPLKSILVDGKVVEIPEDERVQTSLPLSPEQTTIMTDITQYVEGKISLEGLQSQYSSMSGNELSTDNTIDDETKMDNEGEDINESGLDEKEKAGVRALRGMNLARSVALSPYLFYETINMGRVTKPTFREYIDTSPKLTYVMKCIEGIRNWHSANKESMSGIIIYMDRGKDYFELLRKYLIEDLGFKEHEVGIIKSGMQIPAWLKKLNKGMSKDDLKRVIQDRFLGRHFDPVSKMYEKLDEKDRMKILIGSSSIREGMNLQKHTSTLFNCFIDWNPTDNAQLAGRCHRRGNIHKNVRIVNPLMVDSFDIFMFQKLEEKTERINQIWNIDGNTSVLNLEEFNPREMKYELISDPNVLVDLKIDELTEKINDSKQDVKNEIEKINLIIQKQSKFDTEWEYIKAIVDKFRPMNKEGERGVASTIQQYKDILKTQEDSEGNLIYEKYPTNWRWGIDSNQIKKFWGYDDFISAYNFLQKARKEFLIPNGISEDKETLEAYKSDAQERLKSIDEKIEDIKSEDSRAKMIKAEIKEKEDRKITAPNVEKRAEEFATLNTKLLSEKVGKETDFIQYKFDTCMPLYDKNGNRRIDKEALDHLENCLAQIPQTKEKFAPSGEYTDERLNLHKDIIKEIISKPYCIERQQPIAILTGGVAGSGKSTFLKQFAPYMTSDKIMLIDADRIRSMLPEYKGWNADSTQRETKDILTDILDNYIGAGQPCKFDLLFDGTMNKTKNYIPLIENIQRLGYKIFIIFVQVPYKVSQERVLKRYQNPDNEGRYVSRDIVKGMSDAGLDAFNTIKQMVDGYILVDGMTKKVKEIHGEAIPKDREYFGKPFDNVEDAVKSTIKTTDKDRKIKLAKAKAKARERRIRLLDIDKMETGGNIKVPEIKQRFEHKSFDWEYEIDGIPLKGKFDYEKNNDKKQTSINLVVNDVRAIPIFADNEKSIHNSLKQAVMVDDNYTKLAKGGKLVGKSHDKGGMHFIVKDTGQHVELEGGEGVINKFSMDSNEKFTFEGKELTGCEIASIINQRKGSGVKFNCN